MTQEEDLHEDDKVTCLMCNQRFHFISNTHLRKHNLTIKQYELLYPDHPIRSPSYLIRNHEKIKGKSYEDIMGLERAQELKTVRRQSAYKQYEDIEQRAVRSRKATEYWTPDRRKQMSVKMSNIQSNPKNRSRLREKFYKQVSNKNIQIGRQSKQALKWIRDYIIDNSIAETRCYFEQGGIDGSEYCRKIYNPILEKYEYVCYDLVILDEQCNNIDILIEINGPWHYRRHDVIADPDSPCCPLNTNKYSKIESYNKDILKLNYAIDISKKVYVYWLDTKELIQITEKENLLIL